MADVSGVLKVTIPRRNINQSIKINWCKNFKNYITETGVTKKVDELKCHVNKISTILLTHRTADYAYLQTACAYDYIVLKNLFKSKPIPLILYGNS